MIQERYIKFSIQPRWYGGWLHQCTPKIPRRIYAPIVLSEACWACGVAGSGLYHWHIPPTTATRSRVQGAPRSTDRAPRQVLEPLHRMSESEAKFVLQQNDVTAERQQSSKSTSTYDPCFEWCCPPVLFPQSNCQRHRAQTT